MSCEMKTTQSGYKVLPVTTIQAIDKYSIQQTMSTTKLMDLCYFLFFFVFSKLLLHAFKHCGNIYCYSFGVVLVPMLHFASEENTHLWLWRWFCPLWFCIYVTQHSLFKETYTHKNNDLYNFLLFSNAINMMLSYATSENHLNWIVSEFDMNMCRSDDEIQRKKTAQQRRLQERSSGECSIPYFLFRSSLIFRFISVGDSPQFGGN